MVEPNIRIRQLLEQAKAAGSERPEYAESLFKQALAACQELMAASRNTAEPDNPASDEDMEQAWQNAVHPDRRDFSILDTEWIHAGNIWSHGEIGYRPLLDEAVRAYMSFCSEQDRTFNAAVLATQGLDQARADDLIRDMALEAYRDRRLDDAAGLLEGLSEPGHLAGTVFLERLFAARKARDVEKMWRAALQGHGRSRASAAYELIRTAKSELRAGNAEFAAAIVARVQNEEPTEKFGPIGWWCFDELSRCVERLRGKDASNGLWQAAIQNAPSDGGQAQQEHEFEFAEHGQLSPPEPANQDESGPASIEQLLQYLESDASRARAAEIARIALQCDLPELVVAGFQRLQRELRSRRQSGRTDGPSPRFSIAHGEEHLTRVFETTTSPRIQRAYLLDSTIRCMLARANSTSFVDLELETGEMAARQDNLPRLTRALFGHDGCGIGWVRPRSIGEGTTKIYLFDHDATLVAETEIPDMDMGVALFGDLWCVASRDGLIHAFDKRGRTVWDWNIPGWPAWTPNDDIALRPAPLRGLVATSSLLAIADLTELYAVNADGALCWHVTMPENERVLREEAEFRHSIPELDDDEIDEDRRDETLLTLISHLNAASDLIVLGTYEGELYEVTSAGSMALRFKLPPKAYGPDIIRGTTIKDGRVAALWTDDQFHLLVDDERLQGFARAHGSELLVSGHDYITKTNGFAARKGRDGNTLWGISFKNRLTDVLVRGDRVFFASGSLSGFADHTALTPEKQF